MKVIHDPETSLTILESLESDLSPRIYNLMTVLLLSLQKIILFCKWKSLFYLINLGYFSYCCPPSNAWNSYILIYHDFFTTQIVEFWFDLNIGCEWCKRLDEITHFKYDNTMAYDMIYDSQERKQLFSALEASLLSCTNLEL